MHFSKVLRQWYLQNKRDLPWRSTKSPYEIWLSEIILQQTRIDQGLSYYNKFVNAFPKVQLLAEASEESVLRLWQGLGYYSRARNLHYSAKYIVNELNGNFPETYIEILKLRGVGDYTASAIASICFDEAAAVVDGNVYRLLARFFGIETPINTSQGIKEFKALAQELIDVEDPGTHNQALMEFGARMCKPQNPLCEKCPIADGCFALSKQTVGKLPVKKGKVKIRKRYFNYIVISTELDETVLIKRSEGIWINLYEFPLIESIEPLDEIKLLDHPDFLEIIQKDSFKFKLFNEVDIVHKLSHQHLYTKFWLIDLKHTHLKSITWKSVQNYPVPTLIDKFVKQLKNN